MSDVQMSWSLCDGQPEVRLHCQCSTTENSSQAFGPARVGVFTGEDYGETNYVLSFLTYNIERPSIIYEPCVKSYLSGFDFVLLTETFSAYFPAHLFSLARCFGLY